MSKNTSMNSEPNFFVIHSDGGIGSVCVADYYWRQDCKCAWYSIREKLNLKDDAKHVVRAWKMAEILIKTMIELHYHLIPQYHQERILHFFENKQGAQNYDTDSWKYRSTLLDAL